MKLQQLKTSISTAGEYLNPVSSIRQLREINKHIESRPANLGASIKLRNSIKRRLDFQVAGAGLIGLALLALPSAHATPLADIKEQYRSKAVIALEESGRDSTNYHIEVYPDLANGTAIANANGNENESRHTIQLDCDWQGWCYINEQPEDADMREMEHTRYDDIQPGQCGLVDDVLQCQTAIDRIDPDRQGASTPIITEEGKEAMNA